MGKEEAVPPSLSWGRWLVCEVWSLCLTKCKRQWYPLPPKSWLPGPSAHMPSTPAYIQAPPHPSGHPGYPKWFLHVPLSRPQQHWKDCLWENSLRCSSVAPRSTGPQTPRTRRWERGARSHQSGLSPHWSLPLSALFFLGPLTFRSRSCGSSSLRRHLVKQFSTSICSSGVRSWRTCTMYALETLQTQGLPCRGRN